MPEDEKVLTFSNGAAGTARPEAGWRRCLVELHRAVVREVLSCSAGGTGIVNAKGDAVKSFDLAANDAAIRRLEKTGPPLIVESEESARRKLGLGKPEARVVLDPVDGSDNRSRGLPLSAFSCAVLPVDAPLHPKHVEAAIVGPIEQKESWLALKGQGAWLGNKEITTSDVTKIAQALISVELNHYGPSHALARLMASAGGVRSYGCCSRALAFVASGAADAHVDIRRRLTAESYLAGAMLVLEAGGCVVGLDGAPLPAADGLTDRVGLIAAANQQLCERILDCLIDDDANQPGVCPDNGRSSGGRNGDPSSGQF
ncbi:MAG: inositol monophosphatase family protein [Rhodospirillales bacterium]